MPGFFDALEQFKNTPKQIEKLFATIDRRRVEVSRTLYLEIMSHGEHAYEISNGKIVRKPSTKAEKIYPILKKCEEGYNLVDGHPYWPDKKIKGGYEWLIEQE